VIRILTSADRAGAWRSRALCAGHPERANWFGDFPEQTDRAVAVCCACPVREPCLEFALDTQEALGVWGGTTPKERRRLLKLRARAAGTAS